MATVNKDFKIKSGLVVEGTTGTINGLDILTKKQADQDYIVSLIGGTATSANEANKVVKRDANGNFAAGIITANITGDVTGDVTGQVSDISNHDTDDLAEGSRLYFTNQRALDATNTAYDAAGTAATEAGLVAGDLSDHEALTSGVHGVTGSVVGTTDTQDLSNKKIIDTLYFSDSVTVANEAEIEVQAGSHLFNIQANQGDLNLRTTATDASVYVISDDADIVLAANGGSYIGTVAAENEIATKGYANSIATGAENALEDHELATSGIHGVTGNVVGTTDTQTLSNKTLGSDLAAGGYKVSGLLDPSANQDAATKSYVDTAVSNLIGAAPELLDTLNELAEAIGDDEDFIGTVTASIGEKVAKAGDSMSGNLDFGGTNKVTSIAAPTNSGDAANKNYVDTEISTLDTAAQGYADDAETAANSYTDGRETAITTAYQSYADTAEADAKTYADGLAVNYDASGSASAAQTAAEGFATGLNNTTNDRIDDLTTSDIPEGSNLYFTDYAAKVSAVDLLTNAQQNNIEITWTNQGGLVITAENGVADSTTTDLVEGTNLYFTDERAVDALEAVVPNFTAVEVNSVAKQVASTMSAASAGAHVGHAFAKADYRSAEFLVKVAYGTETEISKVLLTLDSSDNIAMTEYGIVGTNGPAMSVTANVDGANVQLLVTTTNNNSTVTVVGTLLA
jgi:hypothetical protein